MNERDEAIALVQRSLPALKQLNDVYDQIEECDRKFNEKYEKRKVFGERFSKAIGRIVGIVSFFVIWKIVDKIFVTFVEPKLPARSWAVLWFIAFVFLVAILIDIFVTRAINLRAKPSKEAEAAHKEELKPFGEEVIRIYTENREDIDILPRDYRYYYAASYLESALINGRADSMKEALNLYETHLHQQTLEANNQAALEIIEHQKETAQYLSEQIDSAE